MAERLLLISHGMAFLTNALISGLKSAGIQTVQVEPELEQVVKYEAGADAFLFFADEDAAPAVQLLEHLKELCESGNKRLCILGYEKAISGVEEIVPKGLIEREFLRPIDVKTLTEELCSMLRAAEHTGERQHILLVDDDATFLRIMQEWLNERYRVTAVKSGTQAITFLATHKPDLILLDYEMPVTSGPQVLEMIRSEPSFEHIPVVFLTGKNDRESVLTAMALDPDGYLLKTSGKDSILANVSKFLAKSRGA